MTPKCSYRTVQREHYIYTLVKPDGTVFYVGKGKGSRMHEHRNAVEKRQHYNPHLQNVILKLWRNGQDFVERIVVKNLKESEAFLLEKLYIATIGLENLCNMTEGGEGMSGHIPSPETRRKRSESLVGHSVSGEAREKISKARTGTKASDATREKMRASHVGIESWNKGVPCGHVDKISGSKNVNAKLTEKDVWEIRYGKLRDKTNQQIADEVGIALSRVSDIRTGKAWKHVKKTN